MGERYMPSGQVQTRNRKPRIMVVSVADIAGIRLRIAKEDVESWATGRGKKEIKMEKIRAKRCVIAGFKNGPQRMFWECNKKRRRME
ncbi:hypothetical protein BZA77DRAFT_357070 [Pyronema omphalodes]|nr:hypothetical protein BZA77DRAFT_357070 [Pyronema omphalodes]